MKFRYSLIALAIVLSTLVINGLDLTHHMHNAWIYNMMIREGRIILYDPFFRDQITYAYGIVAYTVAGLLWFIAGPLSIKIIIALSILFEYIILLKLFSKDDLWIFLLTLLNLFFTIFDAYVAIFSNCIFWLAIYSYYNKKVWWPIPLLISAFNHPYTFISSLFFLVEEPSFLMPEALILAWFLLSTKTFSTSTYVPIYTVFMATGRVITNISPIMVLFLKGRILKTDVKILEAISKVKITLPQMITISIIIYSVGLTIAFYLLVVQPFGYMDESMYEGMPHVDGTIRVIDFVHLPSVFWLPKHNLTLEEGSFRENDPQYLVWRYWDNFSSYNNYLITNNISYVLVCNKCNPPTNEIDLLKDNFPIVWQNQYYRLFYVR